MKNRNAFLVFFHVMVAWLCTCSSVWAQSASLYSFNSFSSTYTYLSGGSSISAIETDDAVSGVIPIGFTFNYCGTDYTQLKASSNGWITFNTSVTVSYNSNTTASLASIKPALFPLWDDLDGSTAYGGSASYSTTGTAPSRTFTIEYRDWQWDYSKTEAVISFQVKLFEGSNEIQFRYKRESGAVAYGSASIGIGDGAATPTYLSLDGTGASPTASSTTFTTSISTKPANGRVYEFVPPLLCTTPAPGATIASSTSICLGEKVNFSFASVPSTVGNTYQWQSSADGTTYTNISGATASTYSTFPTAPAYYRCRVTCSTGPSSTASVPVFVDFAHAAPAVTNGARCGTGTVSLSASGGPGTLVRWYMSASGGTPIDTGTMFTTPVISSTTTYYAGAGTTYNGEAVIGSGGSNSSGSGSSPFSQYYESNHSQYLVLASELVAAGFVPGNLTALSFNITTKYSTKVFSGYTIKLAHTGSSSLSGLLSPSFTTVYGPATYTSVSGANDFSFAAPFNWDGTSNLLVDVCFDNDPAGSGLFYSNNDVVAATSKSYTAVRGMYNDNATLCGATSGGYSASSSLLPVITFSGNKVCSSPRVAVTATVNTAPAFAISGTQTVCNNGVAQLAVTSPVASYTHYVWTPDTSLFTDAACTLPYTPGSSASTVYARTATAGVIPYTCNASNTTTLCAAVASVSVTTLPAAVAAVATPANLCVSGNATLVLSPASSTLGAAMYQWASSPDNTTFTDISSATSGTYTTPTVSATRYYRAAIKNSAGALCLNSSSDTVRVYNPAITGSTGASRCGPGSVTLNVTAEDGTVNWFSASSGGASLGTGTAFTTPSLSSTTTYYAEVSALPDATFTVGTGGTTLGTTTGETGLTPFSGYYEGQHTQYLLLAGDLSSAGLTAGNLNALSFNISTKNSTYAYRGYTIKIAATTATSLSGLLSPAFTTVYGPSDYTTVSGTNTFNFSSDFMWNGTANIVLDVCYANDPSGTGYLYSYNDAVTASTKSYTATYGYYDDDENLCGTTGWYSTSSTKLPVITFKKEGCRSGRTAVVATINPLPKPVITPSPGPVDICEGNVATFAGSGGGVYQWRNSSGHISGATSDSFSTGMAGSYQVIVTDSATGCKDSSDIVTVNVNPKPTVSIAPAGALSICADSAQKYTSVATGSGLTYQWFHSGTEIPGAVAPEYTANTSGTYTLRVYLSSCSDTSNEALLNVNPLPDASFEETGATEAICMGDSLQLTALMVPASSAYQWLFNGSDIPGATAREYYAKTGGYYFVRIRDSNNCRKVSDQELIINTPMGIPDLSPKDAQFCEGHTIKLYANAGAYAASYQWMKDGSALPDTTDAVTSGTTGSYAVTVTDIYGCVARSVDVSVTVMPLPAKPKISHLSSMLSVPGIYSSYQWYRNGKVISGANKRSLSVSFDGKYHVVVSNSFGCYTVSDTLELQNLAVKDIHTTAEIRIYPNPSQAKVYIESPVSVNLSVKDMQGWLVAELNNVQEVDLSPYADGIYLFTITDAEGRMLTVQRVQKRSE